MPSTGRSRCSAASTCTSTRARSSSCSAPTAPARPRRSGPSARWSTARAASTCAAPSSSACAPRRWPALGIAHVPQGRGTFPELTVEENLQVGAYVRKDRAEIRSDIDRSYALFPRLGERRAQVAGSLSGGEQQMLAVARALMSRPRLLLLDEPSLGLAPLIIQDLFARFDELNERGRRDDVHRRAERQPRPRHRRPRLRARGRPASSCPEAPPSCAQTTPCGAPTWASRRHEMSAILAVPGIEDNFFTLTLLLQNLTNALANGAVYALMALTVVMIYKTTGHLNFAQGEMAMFSTFVVYVLAIEQGFNDLAGDRDRRDRVDGGRRGLRTCPDPTAREPQRAGSGDPHARVVLHPQRRRRDHLGNAAEVADPGAVPGSPRRQDRHHHQPACRTSSSRTRRSECGPRSPCW